MSGKQPDSQAVSEQEKEWASLVSPDHEANIISILRIAVLLPFN